jgi:hypothetical protein
MGVVIAEVRITNFQNLIRSEMKKRLREACILVMNHAKHLISSNGAGPQFKPVSITRKGKAATAYRGKPVSGSRSKPGQPPNVDTARLFKSIRYVINDMVGSIGTDVPYGLALEFGTMKMAARPWLRRALWEKKTEIEAIFAAPMR